MAIMGLNDTEESRQLNAQYQVEVSKTLQKIASSTAPEPLFDLSDQELGLLRGDVDAIKQYFPETESNSPSRQAFYGLFDNESTKNRLKSFSEMGVTLVIGKDGTIGGNRELNGGGVQSLGYITRSRSSIPTADTEREISRQLQTLMEDKGMDSPTNIPIGFEGPGTLPRLPSSKDTLLDI